MKKRFTNKIIFYLGCFICIFLFTYNMCYAKAKSAQKNSTEVKQPLQQVRYSIKETKEVNQKAECYIEEKGHCKMVEISHIIHIITGIGVIFSILFGIQQIRSFKREQRLTVFMQLLNSCKNIKQERKNKWSMIKKRIKENPKTSQEITDRTSTLDYLLIRISQHEKLYTIEDDLIEWEIRNCNLINELCRIAHKDEIMNTLLKINLSSEISYYQNRIEDLSKLRKYREEVRLFSKIRSDDLMKFNIEGYFAKLPIQ